MKRKLKSPLPKESSAASMPSDPSGPELIVQIKVWLHGISPMVWRRVLVPSTITLRELHGVIQVAMGWDGIHLYQFCLRAAEYGSLELSASSPDVTLAALRLRKNARFVYEYDLNIPWRHEVRIEGWLNPADGKAYPACVAGDGACPPEDCGGPVSFMANRDGIVSMDGLEDLGTMIEIIEGIVLEGRREIFDDEEAMWRLEQAVDRSHARDRARGRPFSRRTVNDRLRRGEYRELMHQQC